jgi:Ca2+-binding RTX toxin-like protein
MHVPARLAVPAVLLATAAVLPGQADAAAPVKARLASGTLRVTGNGSAQTLALRLKATNPRRLVVDVGANGSADFIFRRKRVKRIVVNTRAGADRVRIDDSGGAFTDTIPTTLDGGAGNDKLRGGAGAETFRGRTGSDTVAGGGGDDRARLGRGDDRFDWAPGDGSDTVDGQDGRDTLGFTGSNATEAFDVAADGRRVHFFRSVGGIDMETEAVEAIDLDALGGADTTTVHDLTGTSLTALDADLGAADGNVDRVTVEGTSGNDAVEALGQPGDAAVTGLAARVRIRNAEPTDLLTINALGGDDTVSAATLPAAAFKLAIDAGDDDDTVTGGAGNDTLLGGAGNDTIDPRRGDDLALLGGGDDAATWNPGDGNDTLEGQAGRDRMVFNGSGGSENVDVSANGQRVRFTRDVGSITMDLDGIEQIDHAALGGADTLTVHDLDGTAVDAVNSDLGADGQPDRVVAEGTDRADVVSVRGSSGAATVNGLAAVVALSGAESALDALEIKARGDDDVVDASALAATVARLTEDGGAADDVLIGSAGADTLLGGAGDDVLLGGPGLDTLDGGPGDNIVIQG